MWFNVTRYPANCLWNDVPIIKKQSELEVMKEAKEFISAVSSLKLLTDGEELQMFEFDDEPMVLDSPTLQVASQVMAPRSEDVIGEMDWYVW